MKIRVIINSPLLVDPVSADICAESGNKRRCFGFVLMKGKLVPWEQRTNCPCQVCLIFKGSADGFWDEFPFFLIELEFW